MPEDIIDKIERLFPDMTSTQQLIATSIMLDPMQVAFSPVKALSEKFGVSPASIVRFSQQLTDGGGYPQLQAEIQAHIRSATNPVKRLEKNTATVSQDENLLTNVYEMQMGNLQKTFNQNLINAIGCATELISRVEHIYTCGSRGCYATAYYLGHHLNRVFDNADIIPDGDRLAEFLMRVTDHDAVIFVCLPRYSSRMLSVAKKLRAIGAKIISITGTPTSPFVAYSDVSLYAFSHSSDFHNSQVSAMLVSEMLVSQAISNNLSRALDNLGKIESLFLDLHQFNGMDDH